MGGKAVFVYVYLCIYVRSIYLCILLPETNKHSQREREKGRLLDHMDRDLVQSVHMTLCAL